VEKLIKVYNNLLKKDPMLAKECSDQFNENMKKSNVKFGDMILSSLLRPYFISSKDMDRLKDIVNLLLRCAEKLMNFFLESGKITELLPIAPEEKDFISFSNGYARSIIICRLDAFYHKNGEIKFLEFNGDSPGGIGYTDVMTKIYLELPIFELIKKKYHYQLYSFDTREHLLKSLLECYLQFGTKKRPTIAIIGWDNIKTRPEFYFIKDHFEKKGYTTIIANPRDLEYRKNRLVFGDHKIDIVYRKVPASQIIKNSEELKGLIKAYKDKKACFANPLNSFLSSFKGVLSIFTDEKFDFLFTDKEKKIINEVIPWTRKLKDCKTEYKGRKFDLLNYITKNKERFVLKPCYLFGAEGVLIGSETHQSQWENTIQKGLRSRYVVQEKIKLPHEIFPSSSSSPSFAKKNINLGLFSLGGLCHGGILRFSSSSIINTIGGGALPIIRVRKE